MEKSTSTYLEIAAVWEMKKSSNSNKTPTPQRKVERLRMSLDTFQKKTGTLHAAIAT